MRVANDQFAKSLSESELHKAKAFAYAKGVRLEDLASILCVLLHNEILRDKDTPVSEVDDHTPKKPLMSALVCLAWFVRTAFLSYRLRHQRCNLCNASNVIGQSGFHCGSHA